MAALVRFVSFALPLLGACSVLTELDGLSTGPGEVTTGDGDALAERAPKVDADADADSTVDAGTADAAEACAPSVTVDSPFSDDLGEWFPLRTKQSGYPKVGTFVGSKAAILLPVPTAADLDAGAYQRSSSAVWYPTAVNLRSFDVEFDAYVHCNTPCADGLNVVWFETTSPALLATQNVGNTGGIPAGLSGAGVILDDYSNDATEHTPSVEITRYDAAQKLGSYDPTVETVPVDFLESWHHVGISMRDGSVIVSMDGGPIVDGKVPTIRRGFFGLTAGTGSFTDAVAVRNVEARFYDCIP